MMIESSLESSSPQSKRSKHRRWRSLHIWRKRLTEQEQVESYAKYALVVILIAITSTTILILIDGMKLTDASNPRKTTSRRRVAPSCIVHDSGELIIECSTFHGDNDINLLLQIISELQERQEFGIILSKAEFKNNKLEPNWLPLTDEVPKLTSLKIESTSLAEISDDSFLTLKDLARLTIANTAISTLSRSAVRGPKFMWELSLQNNARLATVEFGILHEFSLTSLQIQGINYDNIDGRTFFKNLSGESTLPLIQILDLQGNGITTLPNELLPGFPMVQSIYLQSNQIKQFDLNAFLHAQHVRQIHFQSNAIETLAQEIFETLIESGTVLFAEFNMFRCDCDMLWLQSAVKEKISGGDIYGDFQKIKCFSPTELRDRLFLEADFCPNSEPTPTSSTTDPSTVQTEETTESSSTTPSTETPTSTSTEPVTVTPGEYYCQSGDTLTKQVSMRLETGLTKFQVTNDENSDEVSVTVKLGEDIRANGALVWFCNGDNTIKCLPIEQKEHRINSLSAGTDYIFCMLNDINEENAKIGECVVHSTLQLYSNRPWITQYDRPLALAITASLIATTMITCVAITYFIIRKWPTLLRGSSRVEVVKSRECGEQVLVMPYKGAKSVYSVPGTDYESISGYISVTPPAQARPGKRLPPPLPPYPADWRYKNDAKGKEHIYLEPRYSSSRLPKNTELLLEYEWYTSQQMQRRQSLQGAISMED